MRALIIGVLIFAGCSSNPIETATKIEEGRVAVLESGAACPELEKAWEEHSREALADAPFEKMFDFLEENVTKTVGSDSNKQYEEQFCDFLIAHNDVSNAYLEADKRGCKKINFWFATGYNMRSFQKEVYYINDRFAGWDPKYHGSLSAGYWSKECKEKVLAHVKPK